MILSGSAIDASTNHREYTSPPGVPQPYSNEMRSNEMRPNAPRRGREFTEIFHGKWHGMIPRKVARSSSATSNKRFVMP
jgi:hypothetical protein